MEITMKTVSKFVLGALAALTLVTTAAQAETWLQEGGPGVVISQSSVLGPQVAHDAQGE
jgi:hypothetical protein